MNGRQLSSTDHMISIMIIIIIITLPVSVACRTLGVSLRVLEKAVNGITAKLILFLSTGR